MTNPIVAPGDAIIQFTTKAFETQDAFIFETIRPFCEETIHMTITKDELIRALTLLREQEPVKPYDNPLGYYRCGNCGTHVHKYGEQDKYCPRCGKKVKWDETD